MAESKLKSFDHSTPRVSFDPPAQENFEDIDFSRAAENDRETLLQFFIHLTERKEKLSIKNKMLTASVAHFFMEKKISRAFHELTEAEMEENKLKYEHVMEKLKKSQREMEESKNDFEEKNRNLKEELEMEVKVQNEIKNDFKSLIQTKASELMTAGVPITDKFVTRLLERYEKVSKELFDARLDFQKTKNELDEIKAKEEQLDDLGDGYKVMDYENLKTELQTISANIDSKNENLEKLRMRYNSNVEKSEALKCKTEKLMMKVQELSKIYDEKRFEEQGLRWQLNDIRKRKELLRVDFDTLLEQSQLLTKTSLLRNFDSINEEIGNLNQEIEKAQEKVNQKLIKVEEMKLKNPPKVKAKVLNSDDKLKKLHESVYIQKI